MPKAALDHGLRPHLRNRAMRTTRSLARYMPSTKTTLWTSSSPAAVSSHLTVVDAPQSVHLHRWDPNEVLPLRLARPPQ